MSAVPAQSTHRRKRHKSNSQIAHAAKRAGGPAVLELHLIPARRYDSLLQHGRHGLYTTITVTFSAPGHRPLRKILRVSFPHRPAIYNLPRPKYPLAHKHAKPRGKHGSRHR